MPSPLDAFPSEHPSPRQRLAHLLTALAAALAATCVRAGLTRAGAAAVLARLSGTARAAGHWCAIALRRMSLASKAAVAWWASQPPIRAALPRSSRRLGTTVEPARRPAAPTAAALARQAFRREGLLVVATAATTSAAVSLLTLWLWSLGFGAGIDPVSAVSAEPVAAAESPGGTSTEPEPPSPADDAVEDERPVPDLAAAAPAAPAGRTTAPVLSRLVVDSQPAGANVTVDGVGWGVTPVTIRHLTPGSKRIRVTKAGYAGQERVVRVDTSPQTLRITLGATPGPP